MADGVVPASVLVPTTDIYQVEELDIQTPGLKEFLVLLTNNQNITALAVNMKDTGYYSYTQFANGQYYPPSFDPAIPYNNVLDPNPVYRTLVRICPTPYANLGNGVLLTVPHNIPFIAPPVGLSSWRVTRQYGAATSLTAGAFPPNFISIPYTSTIAGNNIELWWDAVNVYIRTAADYTAYTDCEVVLEYIKQPSQ